MNGNILLFQRVIPTYRIPIFKKLYERLGIIVCYSDPHPESSLETLVDQGFPVEKLKRFFYSKSITSIGQNPLGVLFKYHPGIVISEGAPSYLTVWILLFLRKFFKYKLVIWSHGIKYSEIEAPFRNLVGKLKLFLFNKSDSVILYSQFRKGIVEKFINNPSKLFVANNTLDTNLLTDTYKYLSIIGKENIKKDLGLVNKFNLIYIGRLLPSKGLDILINVFKILAPEIDVALHVIGDGPGKNFIMKEASYKDNIHIYGAIYDDIITGKFLYACDLMVMPGYIGLSIIHAFAFGCPVITCKGDFRNGPFHSPEIEYLQDGYNGFFMDKNPEIIAQKILSVLVDTENLELLSKNALSTIQEKATVENMINEIEHAITF